MFTKFTHFLQQAVAETFSPNLTLHEQFLNHWRAVTSYFIDGKDEHQKIEGTRIPGHLERMLLVLLEEEKQGDAEPGATGPCLEYLLQHKLLETLYTLGRTDHPPGMKQVVLGFFTRLLSRIQHPLLPHINVYKVMQRTVKMCGEVKAAPTEKEEIEFLCTVCAKIKADPYLVNFFLETPDRKNVKSPPGKKKTAAGKEGKAAEREIDFSLVNALLSLSHSADGRVQVKSCEGLMLCASLPEDRAADCLVNDTQFSAELAQRLCRLYASLPTTCSPGDIEMVEAKWGLDIITDFEDQQPFHGKRQLISFLSWLDYCDQLINVANPSVAWHLAKVIRLQLLEGALLPALLQTSEMGAITATAYLSRCIRTVCSNPLLTEFVYFLLGDERLPEQPSPSEGNNKLRHKLIERCNHLNEEMSVVTLKLFDRLLQKENEHIFHNLLLRNLLGRNYCRSPASPCPDPGGSDGLSASSQSVPGEAPSAPASSPHQPAAAEAGSGSGDGASTDRANEAAGVEGKVTQVVGETKEVTGVTEAKGAGDVSKKSDVSSSASSTSSSPPSSPHNRPEVHKVVNSFLTLVPEEGKSSYQTADSGYDMYLRDAHVQFQAVELVCLPWKWPKEPLQLPEYQQDAFVPGSFMAMLLGKLSRMLDQSYTVNLLLTAVLARVAMLPHPNVHEFMLDPFLELSDGVKTVYTILKKVAGEVDISLKTDAEFNQKLVAARKQLLGGASTLNSRGKGILRCIPFAELMARMSTPSLTRYNLRQKSAKRLTEGFEGQSRMEAVIVLEEFCKELSAITFVKHHAAVIRL